MALFDQFTNQYSLSKTLRFELKPVGKTRDLLEENQVLIKDERIEKAYQTLKPEFDKLHEEFITSKLESSDVYNINFNTYFELVSELRKLDKNQKKSLDKDFEADWRFVW